MEYWVFLEADLTRFYGFKPSDLTTITFRRFLALTNALYALEDSIWRQIQETSGTNGSGDGWRPPNADTVIVDDDQAAAFLRSIARPATREEKEKFNNVKS